MVMKIDGSMGEGGGQIIRSSLTLSMLTGQPVRFEKIRHWRKKPGLLRQHLTAARAASKISGAETDGVRLGSTSFRFSPGPVRGGRYEFSIGTAGSTMLVLQTVLLPLCLADEPSELVLEGGTHNQWAPTFDFLQRVFLPLLERMGPKVRMDLERPGFYPAGGGRVRLEIEPVSRLSRIDLLDRGEILERRAVAQVANLSPAIAERELKAVKSAMSWAADCLHVEEVEGSRGPGNVLTLEIRSEHITEVFHGFGRIQVSAKAVAEAACKEAREYLSSGAPVGKYLADQLLLPMVIAGGGRFKTLAPSRHTTTQVELIDLFKDHLEKDRPESHRIDVQKCDDRQWLVAVGGGSELGAESSAGPGTGAGTGSRANSPVQLPA